MDPKLIAEFSLEGRTAVVTGAASGIGRETAITFARAGARLVLVDLNRDGLGETVAAINDVGGQAEQAPLDVRDRTALTELAEKVGRDSGLDVWVNAAGVISSFQIVDAEEAELDRILNINLKGVYWACAAAARVMARQGRGSIINISSGGADAPSPGLSVYSMTKAAVNMLTRTLAHEVGGSGVRVNAIAPGYVATNLSMHRFRRPDGTIDETIRDQVFSLAAARTVLGRIGAPHDIATSMLFLACDASSWMTGQILRPNGGMVMP